ncbi:MAG: aldo/keto reductase [Gudongella sp.]|jgi:predicted aldo/keto reductase-like oxidoreductase|nr:aldo/keto reductase [Gudongella sp.]
MQYREITGKKLNVSLLGFGCMRFPVLDGDNSKIDYEASEKMLRYAIENGVNYLDTAYPYHSGKSEEFVGHVLSRGLRDKVYLATKNPVWLAQEHDDFMKYLDEQLVNLQTKNVDFYLLHSLDQKSFQKIKSLNVFGFIENAKATGKIKNIGFSFHDEFPVFKEIIDSYPWDFCQIQLNYIDREYQAGIKGLEYARSKGIDVIVMEPLKGGRLAVVPEELHDIFSESNRERTPAEYALKWVQGLEGVKVVLSGMSNFEQVDENIKISSDLEPLSSVELEIVDKAENYFKNRVKVGCTSCNYCQPCSSGVKIPQIFGLYNNMSVFGEVAQSKQSYQLLDERGQSSLSCVECGECEAICPQQLPIIDLLKEAHNALQ